MNDLFDADDITSVIMMGKAIALAVLSIGLNVFMFF